jgi:hypothetical protein
MSWTWDRYRDSTAVWPPEERSEQQSLARFVTVVDRMFYVAAAAFALSIVALLIY